MPQEALSGGLTRKEFVKPHRPGRPAIAQDMAGPVREDDQLTAREGDGCPVLLQPKPRFAEIYDVEVRQVVTGDQEAPRRSELCRAEEDLPLEPLTDYSRYKALCEDVLRANRQPGFVTLILRPATVCGYAPRLLWE